MNHQLRHYHLGCGHRLQTNFSALKNELRVKFQEMNKKIFEKLNENVKPGSRNVTLGKIK